MEQQLIIMRGLPGSGKSTWARTWVAGDPERRARVNRDELRQLVHNGTFIKGSKVRRGTEKTIIAAEHAMVRRFLEAGLSVVDDNTNLPSWTVKELMKIAQDAGVKVQVKDLTNVPLETCLVLDAQREATVGEEVIRGLHKRYVQGRYPLAVPKLGERNAPKPYVPDALLRRAVIVDIDGTVAKMRDRGPYDWHLVEQDDPNWPVIHAVQLFQADGYHLVFLSGRKEQARDGTVRWLETHVSTDFDLYMRADDDDRPDYLTKLDLFDDHVRDDYWVKLVFDDRDQVVRLWRDLGLACFQVDYGDF